MHGNTLFPFYFASFHDVIDLLLFPPICMMAVVSQLGPGAKVIHAAHSRVVHASRLFVYAAWE